MKWLKNHPYLGTEFDWVASDRNGRLGYFSSAGFGGIPASVTAIEAQMREICDLVARLPERGAAEAVRRLANSEDWQRVARCGFFAYDWSHERECYEPISVPTSPLFLADLASESPVRQTAELSRIDDEFSEG